ncbi:MAG: hypothetical protein B9S33_05565 [Pedosphaera sp. Tous-C6FEB]|nr:MAG: hypothetical protein B9S33_05565 [Pedosphaera sp. Tous-C6FEB]
MPTDTELAAYLDGSLPAADRARLEAEAERNPALRRQLVQHARMEAALRAALGDAEANATVRRSVLAVTQGEAEATLKQRVLSDTVHLRRTPSWREELAAGWARVWRLPTFAGAAAVLLLLVALWPKQQTTHQPLVAGANLELPARLLAADEVWRALGGEATRWRAVAGATLRLPTNAPATLVFADGSALQLDPGTVIEFSAPADAAAAGGKQLRLLAGSFTAQVKPQPAGRPLRVHTPHAVVTVVGTEFGLSVAGAETQLEVITGSVKLARPGGEPPLAVGAGETALASATVAPRATRLPRNPLVWPFASDSPWNRPLGAGAEFEPVTARAFTVDGPLQDATRSRRPFLASPAGPLRGVWERGRWRGDIRFGDVDRLPLGRNESVVILQPARRMAVELLGIELRADGDLEAAVVETLDLAGSGIGNAVPGLRPHGFSSLGGLLRFGEPHDGVRHALAARISADRLRAGAWPTWPAMGNAVPPGRGSAASNLRIGSLLALPPGVDLRALGLGTNGPGYELARALQDFGVYVTGVGPEPFVLLLGEERAGAEWEAPALNRLVPLLQVVRNNTPQTPGGGGIPRREPAPELVPR